MRDPKTRNPSRSYITKKALSMKEEKSILMSDALWFNPERGRERYKTYMEKIRPLLEKHGGHVKNGGIPSNPSSVNRQLCWTGDTDLIFMAEYPSWRAFLEFTRDPEYTDVRPYREEAIVKSLLVRCDKLF